MISHILQGFVYELLILNIIQMSHKFNPDPQVPNAND